MINIVLLKHLYRSKTVTPKNWLDVLSGQFEKRRKIEQEWIEYRSYIGTDIYKSSMDVSSFNLDWSKILTYNDISLRHKVVIKPNF